MGRGLGDYAKDFWHNLFADMPASKWWGSVLKNRMKAGVAGCCGNRGAPGC